MNEDLIGDQQLNEDQQIEENMNEDLIGDQQLNKELSQQVNEELGQQVNEELGQQWNEEISQQQNQVDDNFIFNQDLNDDKEEDSDDYSFMTSSDEEQDEQQASLLTAVNWVYLIYRETYAQIKEIINNDIIIVDSYNLSGFIVSQDITVTSLEYKLVPNDSVLQKIIRKASSLGK